MNTLSINSVNPTSTGNFIHKLQAKTEGQSGKMFATEGKQTTFYLFMPVALPETAVVEYEVTKNEAGIITDVVLIADGEKAICECVYRDYTNPETDEVIQLKYLAITDIQ